MLETLWDAYKPLILWTSVGLVVFRFIPDDLPRLLGRALYWIGIPLEVFALTRNADLTDGIRLVTLASIAALIVGLVLSWSSLKWLVREGPAASPDVPPAAEAEKPVEPASETPLEERTALKVGEALRDRHLQGSYLISSITGNTGFVGLAIAPLLVEDKVLGMVVFYNIAHSLFGTYGLSVLISSYFGRDEGGNNGWIQIRDLLTVPSLWAFVIGYATQDIDFPATVDVGLERSIWVVIPCAFVLMGIRLAGIQGWNSLKAALVPAAIKVGAIPLSIGAGMSFLGLPSGPTLAMVLMSGMPTGFACLILAEEYDTDRNMVAASIILTTIFLFLAIPIWLLLFG